MCLSYVAQGWGVRDFIHQILSVISWGLLTGGSSSKINLSGKEIEVLEVGYQSPYWIGKGVVWGCRWVLAVSSMVDYTHEFLIISKSRRMSFLLPFNTLNSLWMLFKIISGADFKQGITYIKKLEWAKSWAVGPYSKLCQTLTYRFLWMNPWKEKASNPSLLISVGWLVGIAVKLGSVRMLGSCPSPSHVFQLYRPSLAGQTTHLSSKSPASICFLVSLFWRQSWC